MDRLAQIQELMHTVLPVDGMWSMLPVAASKQAQDVDPVFNFITWSCVVLALMLWIPMFHFCRKYKRRHAEQKALSQKDHSTVIEIIWSSAPLVYLAILFVIGFVGFLDMYTPPLDAKELKVIGQKWMWTVQYPDEDISISGQGGVIGVKVNEPVKLLMTSQDVIHSFFIPNFRVKQDVVPGRYSTLWFTPTMTGEFPVFCTEFCGDEHSDMMAVVKVMEADAYDDWVNKIQNADNDLSPTELGKKLFTKKGCNACHSLDGKRIIGPTFKGLFGKKEKLTNGKTIVVDDAYIQRSLVNPMADVPEGYPPVMPTFRGQLSEIEIAGIIAFIKSLK